MTHPICRLVWFLSLLTVWPSHAEPVALAGTAGAEALRQVDRQVEGTPQATTHNVLIWSNPPVEGARYALSGRVEYEGVEKPGYLEMWSHFGAEGSFFSRTLADAGPLAKIAGDSQGRVFTLPFDTGDSGLRPQQIELNIVLPGPGRVTVRELRWTQGENAAHGAAIAAGWGGRGVAARLGAALGVALGVLGAVGGVLCGMGRARGVAMAAFALSAGLGGLCLGGALVAALGAQSSWVVTPLLAFGALAIVVSAVGYGCARRRYADLEFRKMRAIDLDAAPVSPRS